MPKQKKPEKSLFLAAILSFFIPGIGQWYKGQGELGLVLFVVGLLTMMFWPIAFLYRIVVALDAASGFIAESFYATGRKPAPKRTRKKAPVKKKPKKKYKVSKPKAPSVESPEKVLIRTLLDVVDDNDYYRVKIITNKMAEKYPKEQDWLNTRWVGRTLNEIGFKERRRMSSGMEVRLSPANVRKVARKFKVLVYSL